MSDWDPKRPYQELPLLPPRKDVETKGVLKRCIEARAALAELKQSADLIPNPAILINTLPLLEARASSEIENVFTTTDKLFENLRNDANSDPATKEALRYSRALFQGFESLRTQPLNTRAAEKICSGIKGVEMTVRKLPGTALGNPTTGEIVYIPPEGDDLLREKLANWEQYLHNENEIDPLVRMAVGHYQFEAIHPFSDGNGRTGRIINSLFLIEQELLTLPILYLSRHILKNRVDYNRLLLNVTRSEEWQPWIEFMLSAVEETSNWTTAKIAAIRLLAEHTRSFVMSELPKIYSYELVDTIFELPYCRIANLTEKKIAKRQTASIYLKELVRIGVLSDFTKGRERLFVHPKLMQMLSRDVNDFVEYSSAR